MSEQFTEDQLSFLASSLGKLAPTCMCEANHTNGMCGEEAAVTVKMHLPHICRHPDLVRAAKVDPAGCATQILCVRCYWEARHFTDAKLAQVRAVTHMMSGVCQSCGFGLRASLFDTVLDMCPRCSTERIQFEPVCGAGVRDRDGNSHGCGKPLNTYTDVIVHEEWMVPNREGGTP